MAKRVKCPVCEEKVPKGRPNCPCCGVPIPQNADAVTAEHGEPAPPPPGPPSGPSAGPSAGPSNDPYSGPPSGPGPTTGPIPRPIAGPSGTPPMEPTGGPEWVGSDSTSPYGEGRNPYDHPSPFGPGASTETPPPGGTPGPYGEPPDPYRAPGPYGDPPPPGGASAPYGAPFGGPPDTPPHPWEGPQAADAPKQARDHKTPALIAVIAILVVLVGGLAFALVHSRGGSGSPASASSNGPGAATDTAGQASAVNAVLKSGKQAHDRLPGGLATCDDLAKAAPAFAQLVKGRQQELAKAKALRTDKLPNGAKLKQAMVTMYENSLAADQAYASWSQAEQSCGPKAARRTPDYDAAVSANNKAAPAKRQVVSLWNPIAGDQNLPTYAWRGL